MENQKKYIISNIVAVISMVAMTLGAISFSIGVPICVRPFYYSQITQLKLPEQTGYTYEVIKGAFDEVMDFLLLNKPFGTGALHYSQSGQEHFEDCKGLFLLDLWVCVISIVILLLILIVKQVAKLPEIRYRGFRPCFYSGIAAIAVPGIFGIYAAMDFENAFILFHKIFFPGKTNWVFNPYEDEIINILPETFFANCLILIVAVLLIICAAMIIYGKKKKSVDIEKMQ